MSNRFDNLPTELKNHIYGYVHQMQFANVRNELNAVQRYIYPVNPDMDICRGIIEWMLPNQKILTPKDRYIYIFNFTSDNID